MDRLHEMEVFVAVAGAGSFARAGARLRISPPAGSRSPPPSSARGTGASRSRGQVELSTTPYYHRGASCRSLTRAVSSLEERLGARLLTRTTRSVGLTEAGVRFLESAKRLLAEIEVAERGALGGDAVPAGHLVVTASVNLGRSAVAPVVSEFLRRHARVTASLVLVDRVVNLVEEGVDVAVRIGKLADSSLVARRVGEVQRLLVASPGYLARHGEPRSPAELKRHSIIAFTGLMPNRELRFGDGTTGGHVALRPQLEINDAAAALAVCEAGDGITIVPSYMVADEIAAGRLKLVLGRYAPPPVPVQLVHPGSRLLAPKVRGFLDFAVPRLTEVLRREPAAPEREPARAPAGRQLAGAARGRGRSRS